MPEVGRSYDNGVDFGVFKQVVIVNICFDIRVFASFNAFLDMWFVYVAERDYLDIVEVRNVVYKSAASDTDSDAADVKGFIW